MRTSIEIDDRLMRQAMRASRSRTKRATIEAGLRLLIRTWDQQFEADVRAGKLEAAAGRALRDHIAGRSTKL